ncbi:MAG: hypothetical protein JRN09_06090 [Nitrososphaerota archaeon]|nr:hypothetical protein [Nitrososphaerota archaeon]
MRKPVAYPAFSNGMVRLVLGILACCTTAVWVFTVVDDYLYHTPYFWGQWCGQSGLSQLGRDSCILVYNYYYRLDAHLVDSGVVAAMFLLVSLVCVALLWLPEQGLRTALLRTVLVVAPAEVLAFEVGVYFLLNYWWTVHATEFLSGTPFSNEAVFWISAAVLCLGASAAALDVRAKGRRSDSERVNTNGRRDAQVQ